MSIKFPLRKVWGRSVNTHFGYTAAPTGLILTLWAVFLQSILIENQSVYMLLSRNVPINSFYFWSAQRWGAALSLPVGNLVSDP